MDLGGLSTGLREVRAETIRQVGRQPHQQLVHDRVGLAVLRQRLIKQQGHRDRTHQKIEHTERFNL